MDGRRRLAEPVTDGAPTRPAAGTMPASRRARMGSNLGRTRFARSLRRWFAPMLTWQIPRGAGIAAAMAFVLASAAYGIIRGGHLPQVIAELRDFRHTVASAVGFRITSVALAGQRRLTRDEILTAAGITGRSSLLFLDAAEARARLKDNPWIAEATILKLYPGRLHIEVTERDAFALWQRDGNVEVIADDGTVVERFDGQHFAKLPLVVGVGAETRAKRAATGGAAAKRATAKDDAEAAAAREAAEREAAAERAERERAKAERKALEAQLRDARGSLRVRERAASSAAADVKRAESEKARAMNALAAAQRTAEDAQAELEAAERVLAEATAALSEARDDVGRIEERLD